MPTEYEEKHLEVLSDIQASLDGIANELYKLRIIKEEDSGRRSRD